MAKVTYLEIVEMLGASLKGKNKEKLEYIIARKKTLKDEDADLDAVLDSLLRDMQAGRDKNAV